MQLFNWLDFEILNPNLPTGYAIYRRLTQLIDVECSTPGLLVDKLKFSCDIQEAVGTFLILDEKMDHVGDVKRVMKSKLVVD